MQSLEDGAAAAAGLTAALQDRAIAGANRQRSDLHHRIRTGLKNHTHHPQRHTEALQHQPLVQFPVQLPHTQGIRQLRHLAHAFNRRAELVGIELEACHQCRRQTIGRGGLQIGTIGRHDRGR